MSVTKKNSYQTWFGTAAEQAAFTSMLLGDKYFAIDTGLMYVYTGAAWVADSEDVLTLGAGTSLIGKVGIDQVTADANKVVIKNNAMELYGASTATRPLATAVAAGTTFFVVSASPSVSMSDGTNWIDL